MILAAFYHCSSKDEFARFIILQGLLSVLCELFRFDKDYFGEELQDKEGCMSQRSQNKIKV